MINLKTFFKSFALSVFILFATSIVADDDNYSPLDSPNKSPEFVFSKYAIRAV